ncbi:MAG: hypothetical protein P1U63_11120 [Coxiellaceae bacterium]|nr:hypothetical protein [Coxiellaceae bacterium]
MQQFNALLASPLDAEKNKTDANTALQQLIDICPSSPLAQQLREALATYPISVSAVTVNPLAATGVSAAYGHLHISPVT